MSKKNKVPGLGNVKDPAKHSGLLHKLLSKLKLQPGTWLYDEAEGEAVLAMVRSIDKHDERRGQYNTYAGRAAYNAAIGVIRRYRREVDAVYHLADKIQNTVPKPDSTKAIELMYRCIEHLDPVDKTIVLGALDGISLKSLSKRVRLSYETVKMRYHVALSTLRSLMLLHDCGELDCVFPSID